MEVLPKNFIFECTTQFGDILIFFECITPFGNIFLLLATVSHQSQSKSQNARQSIKKATYLQMAWYSRRKGQYISKRRDTFEEKGNISPIYLQILENISPNISPSSRGHISNVSPNLWYIRNTKKTRVFLHEVLPKTFIFECITPFGDILPLSYNVSRHLEIYSFFWRQYRIRVNPNLKLRDSLTKRQYISKWRDALLKKK